MNVFTGIVTIILLSTYFQVGSSAPNLSSTECSVGPISAAPQHSGPALPVVTAGEVPLYPPLARVAGVEGNVRLQVTTDGQRVIGTHIEDGNGALARSAEANVKTWRFARHK